MVVELYKVCSLVCGGCGAAELVCSSKLSEAVEEGSDPPVAAVEASTARPRCLHPWPPSSVASVRVLVLAPAAYL